MAGSHGRAVKRAAASAGTRKDSVGDDLTATIGNTGTAHAGLLLADALDRAGADQLIAVVSLADGADAVIWRTSGALASRRARLSVASQAAGGGRVPYAAFLTWRVSSTASRRGGPIPSGRRPRRRSAARRGSSPRRTTYQHLSERWIKKIQFCEHGELRWGLFLARRLG